MCTARYRWRLRAEGKFERTRGLIISSKGAHSSIASACRAMDADEISVPSDSEGRLHVANLRRVVASLEPQDRERVFAIVATCGTTNAGVIDDLDVRPMAEVSRNVLPTPFERPIGVNAEPEIFKQQRVEHVHRVAVDNTRVARRRSVGDPEPPAPAKRGASGTNGRPAPVQPWRPARDTGWTGRTFQ